MATHSSILAWKVAWADNLVGYSLWGHKELDLTEYACTQDVNGCEKVTNQPGLATFPSRKKSMGSTYLQSRLNSPALMTIITL